MSYVRGDRFNIDFMQRRAWSLHRFIKRLTLHPVLRRASIFILFLETADWNAQMRLRPGRSSMSGDGGPGSPVTPSTFFDNVADTMMNAFSKVHKPDKRFIEVQERTTKLDEDLGHVEKIVSRVVRRESDLEADYNDLATNMRRLVALEPAVEAQLQTFAACVEETSRGWQQLKEHTDQNYLGSLRDMQAYIGSTQSLLKARDQKQIDFEALTEYLQKAAAERDQLASALRMSGGGGAAGGGGRSAGYTSGGNANGGGGESGPDHRNPSSSYTSPTSNLNLNNLSVSVNSLNPATFIRNKMDDIRGHGHGQHSLDQEAARQERCRKLELRVEELSREVNGARSTSEMFDEHVVREVADFERIKSLEFRDTLGALAGAHEAFYRRTVDTWERFLGDMEEGEGGGGGGVDD